jgi:hypothetical protein
MSYLLEANSMNAGDIQLNIMSENITEKTWC